MVGFMKRVNIHSLWSQCFLFVFTLIVLPILTVLAFSNEYNEKIMLEQKRVSDLKNLNSLALNIDTLTESIESYGKLLAQTDTIRNEFLSASSTPAAKFAKRLEAYSSSIPSISAISLMNPSGIFWQETEIERNRLSWFFNKTLLQQLSKTPAFFTKSFSIEYVESGLVERVISYIQPCYDENNVLLGYLVFYINTDTLKQLLSPFDNSTFILENGCVFASQQEIPFYLKLFQLYNINYGYLEEDNSVILNSDTVPYVVTSRSYPKLQLQFVSMTSYEALKESLQVGFPSFYSMAIYGTLFALLSASLLARQLTKRLLKLKKVMKNVTSGDFHTRYQTNGKDEVAELGHTFNSLLDTIERLLFTQKQNYKNQQKIQFQLIQEQIKPHFLYNMLETINSLIRSNYKDESIHIVNNLASFYRISLNNGSDIISIAQEIRVTENYLALQTMRYIEFMDYSVAFSPNIYQYSIPKLVLQPIVENAIYHGLKEKCQKGMLFISGYMENNYIIFEVFDTGCGMSEEKITEIASFIDDKDDIENHFGISSVIKRLNLFTNGKASLVINSVLGEYTCVTISYPVNF